MIDIAALLGPEPTPRVLPLEGQVLAAAEIDGDYDEAPTERRLGVDIWQANLVTSLIDDGSQLHRPVLDVDLPVHVVPSSTPGHCHLYIDKAMSWGQYARLITVLAEVGIVEPGYAGASFERGHTAVRAPWIKKAQVPTP